MWSTRTKVGWALTLTLAAVLALVSARYFSFDSDVYLPQQREVYEDKVVALMVHISAMTFATLAGPFQFLRNLRRRHPRLHRVLGRVYVAGTIIGGVSGLYMAQYTAAGIVSDVAFALLAAGVLLTTVVGLQRIRSGQVQSHKEWMTRSYAFIFAAVTLRLYLPALEPIFGWFTSYAIASWACWVVNVSYAEWLIRRRMRRSPEGSMPSRSVHWVRLPQSSGQKAGASSELATAPFVAANLFVIGRTRTSYGSGVLRLRTGTSGESPPMKPRSPQRSQQ